jgi:hypothetical protein
MCTLRTSFKRSGQGHMDTLRASFERSGQGHINTLRASFEMPVKFTSAIKNVGN